MRYKVVNEETKKLKRKTNWLTVFTFFSLCLSIITFILTEFPYLKPWNSDLLAMAKSGDAVAQTKLANYYCIVGDDENGVYWYQLIAERSTEFQAMAINNVAYLYLVNEDKYKPILPDFYNYIIGLFIEAYEKGCEVSQRNIYKMMKDVPVAFIKDNYSKAYEICSGFDANADLRIDSSEWIYDHHEELTIKSDKWRNGGYTQRIDTINGEDYLYISELESCKTHGIGDVDLNFKVTVYKRTADKRKIYTYIIPPL